MNPDFVEEVIAGDTLDFRVEVPDYPNTDGWTLKYRLTARFTTPTQASITLTALNNADGSYQIQEAPGTTAAWQPGSYTWARWVEKSGARQTLSESGQLKVKANPATTAQGFDGRSHVRKVLEALQAAMEGRALSSTQRELVAYTIGSRSQTFDSQDDREALRVEISKYEWLVANEDAREKIAAGQPNSRNVGIRFGRP